MNKFKKLNEAIVYMKNTRASECLNLSTYKKQMPSSLMIINFIIEILQKELGYFEQGKSAEEIIDELFER